MKNVLDIDNCIMIHDLKQIKKEPPGKKIKSKRQLAKKILKKKLLKGSESSIYTKLWRNEKDGFVTRPDELIDAVLNILEIEEKQLVLKKPVE
jgi:hypothetical protein